MSENPKRHPAKTFFTVAGVFVGGLYLLGSFTDTHTTSTAAAVSVPRSAPTAAPVKPAATRTYGPADVDKIVEVSRSNDLAFDRDYRDQNFSGVGYFDSVQQGFLSKESYDIHLKASVGDFMGKIHCRMAKTDLPAGIDNWRKDMPINVVGTMRTTVIGFLQLEDCALTAVPPSCRNAQPGTMCQH
jgi:hypothetical protein